MKPFPGVDVPLIATDPQTGKLTGMMTQTWTEYFQSIQTFQNLANLRDVSTTAPTNGQVLIYNSTTKLWTPGTN
jgi:hypothetical protein